MYTWHFRHNNIHTWRHLSDVKGTIHAIRYRKSFVWHLISFSSWDLGSVNFSGELYFSCYVNEVYFSKFRKWKEMFRCFFLSISGDGLFFFFHMVVLVFLRCDSIIFFIIVFSLLAGFFVIYIFTYLCVFLFSISPYTNKNRPYKQQALILCRLL